PVIDPPSHGGADLSRRSATPAEVPPMNRGERTPVGLYGVLVSWGLGLSVPAIQLPAPSCANGGPNRGTLPQRHYLLLSRRHGCTRRPFADIRQHGSAPLLSLTPLL